MKQTNTHEHIIMPCISLPATDFQLRAAVLVCLILCLSLVNCLVCLASWLQVACGIAFQPHCCANTNGDMCYDGYKQKPCCDKKMKCCAAKQSPNRPWVCIPEKQCASYILIPREKPIYRFWGGLLFCFVA